MTNNNKCQSFEDRMFTAWVLHDKMTCVKCRFLIKKYYQYHYQIKEALAS